MRDVSDHIGTEERHGNFRAAASAARHVSWSMTGSAGPSRVAEFEALLLAIAGHDLRQPLQVIQSAHELLGHGIRTAKGMLGFIAGSARRHPMLQRPFRFLHASDLHLDAPCHTADELPAHLIDLQAPAANTAAVTKKQDSGINALSGVRFQGKKQALEIGDSADGMQSGSSK